MVKLSGNHIHGSIFSNQAKYCVQHNGRADQGEWVTSKDGLRRRFICMNCIQNEKNRSATHSANH